MNSNLKKTNRLWLNNVPGMRSCAWGVRRAETLSSVMKALFNMDNLVTFPSFGCKEINEIYVFAKFESRTSLHEDEFKNLIRGDCATHDCWKKGTITISKTDDTSFIIMLTANEDYCF